MKANIVNALNQPVAIIGMGCIPFAEHWDAGVDEMLVDAAHLAYDSAGIAQDDIDAFWLGTSQSGASAALRWIAVTAAFSSDSGEKGFIR